MVGAQSDNNLFELKLISMICKTSMFVFDFFIVLSLPWTCLGQQKKARIDLKLVDGICGQYAAFETTKLLQPPLKKSVSSIHGEVRWQNCADGMECIKSESQYPVERVLGVQWDPNSDAFIFKVKFHKVPSEILLHERIPTKREVLKVITSIFDPLGFISNYHIKGKILLQEIWKSGIGWDNEIGDDIYIRWCLWLDELKLLINISVPRWYGFGSSSKLQLHIFCDASSMAYAAVGYLRCETVDGIRVSFLMSKTRVAPLKPMTIPRLELMAAVTGSRMAQRLGEIDELTDVKQWNWVSSKDNVADEATRNEAAVDLSNSSRWLNGPSFLKLSSDAWPKELKLKSRINDDGINEVLEFVNLTSISKPCLPDVYKFSSMVKLLRATAWMMRFISRCKGKSNKSKVLNPDEIIYAEKMWWQNVQWECYSKEMAALSNNKLISSTSSLRFLCPKVDDGVMRLTSRTNKGACNQ
ncbi:unnamed protein product, partial [Allacma fusca]